MELADFLALAGRTPFVWGQWDCSLWLADWLVARGHPDPAAHLRGRYHTAIGCRRVLRRLGGVLGAVEGCAVLAGLTPTDEPGSGDIAVIEATTRRGIEQVGAIRTGARWAALAANGLVARPSPFLAAWRV